MTGLKRWTLKNIIEDLFDVKVESPHISNISLSSEFISVSDLENFIDDYVPLCVEHKKFNDRCSDCGMVKEHEYIRRIILGEKNGGSKE